MKVGIVGLGKMGLIRAKELAQHDGVTVTVGADTDQSRFSAYPGVQCSEDWRDVVNSDVDAVFVCTPNYYIADAVVCSLDSGKHVFAEKPPGRTIGDVERMIDAEKRHPDLVLKFGFNHRYHAGIQHAKKILDSGRLGKIIWARGVYGKEGGLGFEKEWRSSRKMCGGGILLDQGIHMLDLFRFFMGDFVEIKSMVTTSFWDIELEDNAFGLLRDAEGRVAMVHSSSTQWKHRFMLELYTTDGYLSVNGILSSTRSYGDETITVGQRRFDDATATGKPREEIIYFDTDPSWHLEVNEFLEAVQNGRAVEHGTSHDALAVMQLVHRIYQADESWPNDLGPSNESPDGVGANAPMAESLDGIGRGDK